MNRMRIAYETLRKYSPKKTIKRMTPDRILDDIAQTVCCLMEEPRQQPRPVFAPGANKADREVGDVVRQARRALQPDRNLAQHAVEDLHVLAGSEEGLHRTQVRPHMIRALTCVGEQVVDAACVQDQRALRLRAPGHVRQNVEVVDLLSLGALRRI